MAEVTRVRIQTSDQAILYGPFAGGPSRAADPFLDAECKVSVSFTPLEVANPGAFAVWVWVVEQDSPNDRDPRVLTAGGWVANLDFATPRGNEDEILEHSKSGQRIWDESNASGMRLMRPRTQAEDVTIKVRVQQPSGDDDTTPHRAEFRVYAAIVPVTPEVYPVRVGNAVNLPIVIN